MDDVELEQDCRRCAEKLGFRVAPSQPTGYAGNSDGLQAVETSYDPNNNIIQTTERIAGQPRTSTYSYDQFDRLTQQNDPYGAQARTTYDPNGNRLSLTTQDTRQTRYSP